MKNIGFDDSDFILSLFSDDAVNQYLFDAEPLTDIQGAEAIIRFYHWPEPREQHRWIVVRKADEAKMGTCGFHNWNKAEGTVEIGYDLRPEFCGKGYMREALMEMIKFAQDRMSVREIRACIYPHNNRSIHLAAKLGFIETSHTKMETFRGEEIPHHIYALELS